MTSAGSTKSGIGTGSGGAPRPGLPAGPVLPYSLAISGRWLCDEMAAREIVVFAGGGRLVVGASNIELAPGKWIVARVDDVPLGLPANTAYLYPTGPRREVGEGEGSNDQ